MIPTGQTLGVLAWLLLAWGGTPLPAPATPGAGHDTRDGDSKDLLTRERIDALPSAQRIAWQRYIETSDAERARDRASMEAELRAAGKTTMTPAPYLKAFRVGPEMTDAWFRGEDARRAADSMLTFQTPSGGWSKRTDVMTRPRAPGESYFSESAKWNYVATLDNDSTTEEIHFLIKADAGHPDPRYRDAVLRGIDYLLLAQFPNGCWPQGYPLQGGYHDAATFNDNAIINVMRLLSDVAAGKIAFVPAAARGRVAGAVAGGIACILDTQVTVRGARTVWGQQHDPLTLAPTQARSYELVGLSGRESAKIAEYLMSLPTPDARVVAAVDAAVAWFRAHQINGWQYERFELTKIDGPGKPLWARLTDIDTDRTIFSNRDGVKLFDWNLLTDRRHGYGWFGKEPAAVIERYAAWAPGKPRAQPAPPPPAPPRLPQKH